MQCPACNHNGSTADFGQPPRCPECSAFYEKALVARAKRNELAANLEVKRAALDKPHVLAAAPKWLDKAKAILGKDAGRNIVFAAGISFVSLVGIGLWMKPDAKSAPTAPYVAQEKIIAPIAIGALSTYTRDQYPKTYAIWGDSGVARISEFERMAADLVARSGHCYKVDLVGLSEKYSRPPRDIVVYVDCSNRKRAYVGERELAGDRSLVFKKI